VLRELARPSPKLLQITLDRLETDVGPNRDRVDVHEPAGRIIPIVANDLVASAALSVHAREHALQHG
jgi:hypothetical protein